MWLNHFRDQVLFPRKTLFLDMSCGFQKGFLMGTEKVLLKERSKKNVMRFLAQVWYSVCDKETHKMLPGIFFRKCFLCFHGKTFWKSWDMSRNVFFLKGNGPPGAAEVHVDKLIMVLSNWFLSNFVCCLLIIAKKVCHKTDSKTNYIGLNYSPVSLTSDHWATFCKATWMFYFKFLLRGKSALSNDASCLFLSVAVKNNKSQ